MAMFSELRRRRAAWAANWEEVRYCSERCHRRRVRPVDKALEAAIITLLDERARSATICPSTGTAATVAEGETGANDITMPGIAGTIGSSPR